jgi:hypothetical protein
VRRTLGKHLTTLQQMVGVAVPSLLIANLAAVGVLVAVDRDDRPSPGAAETAAARRQLALITLPDGRRFLVDPSTARGRQAIREARAAGGTISTFSVPQTARSGSGAGSRNEFKVPEVDGVIALPEGSALGNVVDSIIAAGTSAAGGVTSTTTPGGGGGGGTGGTIGDLAGDLTEALNDVLDGATTLVGDTLEGVAGPPGATVGGAIGSTVTTVQGVLGNTVTTLQGVLAPVTTLVPSITTIPGTPTTAAPSGGGLLGNLGTTVSSVVNNVTTVLPPATTTPTTTTPTTAAPSPTTTICTLIVLCH